MFSHVKAHLFLFGNTVIHVIILTTLVNYQRFHSKKKKNRKRPNGIESIRCGQSSYILIILCSLSHHSFLLRHDYKTQSLLLVYICMDIQIIGFYRSKA